MRVEQKMKEVKTSKKEVTTKDSDFLLEQLLAEEESDNMFIIVFFTVNLHETPWKLMKFTSAQHADRKWDAN